MHYKNVKLISFLLIKKKQIYIYLNEESFTQNT